MATKSIGATGRDFATCALYASYLDALNTFSAAELGEFYNDSEFSVAGAVMTLAGFVPSASFPLTMRPATGNGFTTASGAITDDQRYDQSLGVAIKRTANYGYAVDLGNIEYVTFDGFQVRGDGGSAGAIDQCGNNSTVDNCLVEDYRGSARFNGASALLRNSLWVNWNAPFGSAVVLVSGADAVNSSILRPSDVSGSGVAGIQISYAGGCSLINVNVFGFATAVNVVSGSVTSTNCYTDLGSPPTGFTTATYANQFENAVASTRDWRTKTGATIIGAGTASGAPATDIYGQTRPNPPSVGHFELITGGTSYTLTAALGTFTLSGQAVVLKRSRLLAAGAGAYSFTGQAVVLKGARKVAAAAGAFSLSGQAVQLNKGTRLAVDAGAFTLAGQAVGFPRTYINAAVAGSFSLGGQPVGLALGRVVAAGAGAYSVSGQAVAFGRGYAVTAAAGSFVLSGQAVGLLIGRRLAIGAGAFTLAGMDAALTYLPAGTLIAGPGIFTLAGQDATLAYSGGATPGGITGASAPAARPKRKRKRVWVGERWFWSTEHEAIADAVDALRRDMEAERRQLEAGDAAPAPRARLAETLDIDAFIAMQEAITDRAARTRRLAQLAREEEELEIILMGIL